MGRWADTPHKVATAVLFMSLAYHPDCLLLAAHEIVWYRSGTKMVMRTVWLRQVWFPLDDDSYHWWTAWKILDNWPVTKSELHTTLQISGGSPWSLLSSSTNQQQSGHQEPKWLRCMGAFHEIGTESQRRQREKECLTSTCFDWLITKTERASAAKSLPYLIIKKRTLL